MYISDFKIEMSSEILSLMINTIKTINSNDYNSEQIESWSNIDREAFIKNIHLKSLVMVKENSKEIIGFLNIDDSGYINHLFTHKDYQKRGIAGALIDEVEKRYTFKKLSTDASITAKPFFISKGFTVIKENKVLLRKQEFTNYSMTKEQD